ncbi:MAG: hypothetical protein AB4057_02560 [Crocosphaera sp.]
MDWLQIIKTIFSSLAIALLGKEILVFIPAISEWIIKTATRMIIPSEHKRYEEEFLANLGEFQGPLCQAFCAIDSVRACICIREELLSVSVSVPEESPNQFYTNVMGNYRYQVHPHSEGDDLEGTCIFKYSPSGNPLVVGRLTGIKEPGQENFTKTNIKWESHSITILNNNIYVDYKIPINNRVIRGRLILTYNENGFDGIINREPIQGRIQLDRYLDKNKRYFEVSRGTGTREPGEGYGFFTFLKIVNYLYVQLLRLYRK